ncbi:uncharacterized protein B0H18DRAFT_1128134 [Fomitopsis serialis]|uniref:uncharacterized protein n=1 Tax=Fomitopsis serialis TaxID=139415 RepID=UPI002007F6FB|nr:uncharacterized protein B0H18DRAFT_1128134 [Neoantrodia serialis]KAH9911790.1 hypothetical protein B0H18DRAFT_1128134 [Neoantrodia serialis]
MPAPEEWAQQGPWPTLNVPTTTVALRLKNILIQFQPPSTFPHRSTFKLLRASRTKTIPERTHCPPYEARADDVDKARRPVSEGVVNPYSRFAQLRMPIDRRDGHDVHDLQALPCKHICAETENTQDTVFWYLRERPVLDTAPRDANEVLRGEHIPCASA